MTKIFLSSHATVRAQQRGVARVHIDAVERYADIEVPRGGGCVSLSISRRTLKQLGPLTPEGVSTDRLNGLVLLTRADRDHVTVFRNTRSGSYRRRGRRWS